MWLALLWPACNAAPPPVDLLLFNGNVITLEASTPAAQALAVDGDRIIAVGTDEELESLQANLRIDLDGRTVVPGLADNHYHSIGGGPGVDLSRTRTLQEVIDRIAERAQDTPEGEVIVTNSDWHEGQLAESRLPYRDDLDEATTAHPVVVVRGGHEYILNTFALEKWGVTDATESPPGGSIGRYAHGRLNGELVDTAKRFVELPESPPVDDPDGDLIEEFAALNRVGLTSIRYGAATGDLYQRLQKLRDRGELTLRVSALLRLPRETTADTLEPALEEWNIDPDDGDAWLSVSGIKLGVDGGFEGGLMREPYEEPYGRDQTFFGLQTMPTDSYIDLVRAIHRHGWRVGTHAVGDRAIDLVLDAYERADADESIADERWAIEHGFIPRDDHFERIRKLGVHVTAQHHLYLAAPSLVNYWGTKRASHVTPLKDYLDAGIPTSLGTDSPVVPYPPLWVLYHFITRDTLSGGVMGADQKVSREDALRAMTIGGAALTFEENIKGSLSEGMLADFVVLEDDLMTCEPERIRDTEVLMTVVGGKIVFQAERGLGSR